MPLPPKSAPAQRQAADARKAVQQAYARVFGSPDGALVLNDLVAKNGLLRTSVEPGDPHMTAFNEGRRAAALDLLNKLRWTPARIVELAGARNPLMDDGPTAPGPETGDF